MFTSRTIIFASLSFLAGANACVQCPATVKDGVSAIKVYDVTTDSQTTFCMYYNSNDANGDGPTIFCQYHTRNGQFIDGHKSCARTATVKEDDCRT
ncbi:uncharacterized protein EDB91DRAFT_1173082 [Suillus paluster]|uniref:uncharacterized protein n=1 Tax=Suillus paluster TaxID=48578 RepID=UPI001B860FF3|nr:uncharacterized protein EDB91DRAFT_1173082 [Suillus paluster]KAG1723366.1 hypothetical protein EDB91DRAFT_1173082 [Suillus paluster]